MDADCSEGAILLGEGEEFLNFRVEIADFLIMPQNDRFEIGAVLSFEEHLLALSQLARCAEEFP